MQIDIENLAKLARIGVSKTEGEKLATDLEKILGYVSELNAVDASRGDATELEPDALRNVMREDVDPYPRAAFTEEILAEAPKTERGFLVVKQILGNK